MRSMDRYSRQALFRGLGETGQQRLGAGRAVVVGCGALGSWSSNLLVRAGVGTVRVVDRDFIEPSNLQRQVLFDEDDIAQGLPKAVAAVRKLARVNSSVTIEPLVVDLTARNAEAILADADVVVDGTDNFETRYLLNDACVKLGKPWVYGGVIGSYGLAMTVVPRETPCLRCVYAQPPPPGVTPTCDTAGVLNTVVGVIASVQCTEAIKLIAGARADLLAGLLHVDVWENRYHRLDTGGRSADCPACGRGRYEFLEARRGWVTATLCGRDAVQVCPAEPERLDLVALAARLATVGRVSHNAYMLRLEVGEHELTVFPDARTIVKGTSDEAVARGLHAKYVGA
jgi:adenylyltransferase/sulfurtransferase